MAYGATYDTGDLATQYDPHGHNPEGTNGVFHDGQGRAYVLGSDGNRRYIQSYDQAQQAHDQSGLFRSYEWNPDSGQNEGHINWGNIIGLAAGAEPLVAGGLALAGAGAAGGAGGGGSAAGAAGGAGVEPVLGGGSTLAANLGSASALPSLQGAGVLGTLGKLGNLGSAISNAAGSYAQGRRMDADTNARAIADNNRANLDAAEFNMNAPMTLAQQTARGDLMSANIPHASMSGSGRNLQLTGGLSPDLFGPDTTAAGDALKRTALTNLMNGGYRYTPQQIQPTRAGTGENIASGVGMGLNILGTLGKLF